MTAHAYEVVLYAGPLPSLGDEPLTKGEEAFRARIAGVQVEGKTEVDPVYAQWAERARASWHERTGVPRRRRGA